MTYLIRIILPVFLISLPGCAVLQKQNSGAGATLSYSCSIAGDYDLYMLGTSYSSKPPPNWTFGVGALGCYPDEGVNFDDGATLSVAGDHRKLPKYLYFWWSKIPRGNGDHWTKAQNEEYEHNRWAPHYWARVAIRSQVPQTVVDEVRKSPPSKLGDGQNELRLHIYLAWTKRGIRLTWAEYKDLSMIKYGGYVPEGPSGELDPWLRNHPGVIKYPQVLTYTHSMAWIKKNHVKYVSSHVAKPEPYRSWPPSQ